MEHKSKDHTRVILRIRNLAVSSVEKEQQDNAQKLKDSQEAGQKVLELQRKLDHAREVVRD